MHRHVLILTLLLAAPAGVIADVQVPTAIPIVLDMDGRITIRVRINGAGSYRFRLDTGASRTVIAANLADHLRLMPAGRSRTITHTGEVSRPLARADAIAVGASGAASVADLLVLVLPREEIDRAGRWDGLLGRDVLAQWVFAIEYRTSQLLLSAEPAAEVSRGVRLPLVRGAGGLVAAVDFGRAGPAYLVPDSGADRLVLFGDRTGAWPSLTMLDSVRVRSVAGDVPARLVRLDRVEVGGIPIGTREAILLSQRPVGGLMGDGLLPLHLFGRVTFDLAGGFLWLEAWR